MLISKETETLDLIPNEERETTVLPSETQPPTLLLLLAGFLLPCILAYALATTSEARVTAVVFAILGVSVILVRPLWGLIFFVGLIYVRPEETIPALAGMRMTLLVGVVTLFAASVSMMINRERITKTPFNGMIAGFLAVALAATFQPGNTGDAAQELAKILILVLLTLNLVRTPEQYRTFISALLIFTSYLAFTAIRLYFTGGALQQWDSERAQATGIFEDPNDLAATIIAGLALSLVRVRQSQQGRARWYAIAFSAFLIYGLLLTNSRGGMLALLTVVSGFIITGIRRKGLGVALAYMAVMLILAAGPSRMTSFESDDESANQRFWYWKNGIEMFMAHPLTGVGYRQFVDNNGGMTAHNTYVLCFSELGLPGYFFWIGCIYYGFRRRSTEPELGEAEETEESVKDAKLAETDLLGARLALAGYLMASFWISRSYILTTYLTFCLPIIAMTVRSPGSAPLVWIQGEWKRDWPRILLISILSIIFINLMADHYR